MDKNLEAEVRRRAGNRCEYCQIPESLFDVRHEIDHVIARQHRGATVPSNLALCCGRCNLHKGPNVAGVDPVSRSIVPLFNPREDRWTEHFRWNGVLLDGITPTGRATVDVLAINLPNRVATRRIFLANGDIPGPSES